MFIFVFFPPYYFSGERALLSQSELTPCARLIFNKEFCLYGRRLITAESMLSGLCASMDAVLAAWSPP